MISFKDHGQWLVLGIIVVFFFLSSRKRSAQAYDHSIADSSSDADSSDLRRPDSSDESDDSDGD